MSEIKPILRNLIFVLLFFAIICLCLSRFDNGMFFSSSAHNKILEQNLYNIISNDKASGSGRWYSLRNTQGYEVSAVDLNIPNKGDGASWYDYDGNPFFILITQRDDAFHVRIISKGVRRSYKFEGDL